MARKNLLGYFGYRASNNYYNFGFMLNKDGWGNVRWTEPTEYVYDPFRRKAGWIIGDMPPIRLTCPMVDGTVFQTESYHIVRWDNGDIIGVHPSRVRLLQER